jgi:hypothetical protein
MQRSRVFEDPTPERSGLIFNTTWIPACSATTAYPVGVLQQPELLHHLVGGDERRGATTSALLGVPVFRQRCSEKLIR